MRIAGFALTSLLLGAAWMCGGCRTIPDGGDVVAEPGGVLFLSEEGSTRAQALAYYSAGLIREFYDEYDAAFSNYQEAVRLDPDNEELALRMAMGLLQQKRNQEAIETIEALSRRRPESRKALLWLALIYRATSQQDMVQQTYERLIERFPADATGYVELAALHTAQGRDGEAIALLDKALGRVDDPSDILRALGGLHAQRAMTQTQSDKAAKSRQEAIRLFEQLAQEHPEDVAALYQLGDLYILNQQIEKAIECFETIEAQHPGNLQVKQKLALSFIALGDKEKAADRLEQIASRRSDNPRVFYYLGELYQEMGDSQKAVLNFELAAKAGPTDPAPILKLALLRLEKSPQAAVDILKEGLLKLPDDPRLLEMLAYVHLSEKEYKEAADTFEKAVQVFMGKDPSMITPSLYFNYAVAAQKAGRMDKTASLLAQALEFNPSTLEAYVQYSLRQTSPEAQNTAVDILELTAQKAPDNAFVHLHLGTLQSALKRYPQAIVSFERADELLKQSEERNEALEAFFYFWYGAACERDGQFDRAEVLFEKSIALDPSNPEPYNYLAYMWAERSMNLDKALEYVQKALSITPDSGAYLDTLGWVFYMQGRYAEARVEILKALEVIPDDSTILEHLGDILLKLGRDAEASEQWKKALLEDPDSKSVADKLKSLGVDIKPLLQEAQKRQKELEQKETGEDLLLEPDFNSPPSEMPDEIMDVPGLNIEEAPVIPTAP